MIANKGNTPWYVYPHCDVKDYDENVVLKAQKTCLNKNPHFLHRRSHDTPLFVTKHDTFKNKAACYI